MKKIIMTILMTFCMLTAVFADDYYNIIKKSEHEYLNGDYSYLGLAIHSDDTSIATIALSYKEDGCSRIIIYIDTYTEDANKLYNKFYDMSNSEFKEYIFNDFTDDAKYINCSYKDIMCLYTYDSEDDAYFVNYSYIGK